jgi:O-antigen/teichoic acid export membrane protein
MSGLLNVHRLRQLFAVAGAQTAVQAIGFVAGIVLVRTMAPQDYGYLTLALALMGTANTLTDLGLSAAVMAQGGRAAAQGQTPSGVLVDAAHLHRRLALLVLPLLVPIVAWMLWRLGAPTWQVVCLTALLMGVSLFHVRSALLLSVIRLSGQVGFQQKLDLALNVAKLSLFLLALFVAFAAPAALAVVFCLGAVQWLVLRQRCGEPGEHAAGRHVQALHAQVRRQAPNTLYYVFSTQIALWLIGVFGNAQTVAEVGALGRLAAVFAIVASVSAVLIQPYFARRQQGAELRAAFVSVNAFFAFALAALLLTAHAAPQGFLWILGGHYGNLRAELPWVVAASTLAAWGNALYSLGAVRGWIPPVWLAGGGGVIAVAAAASIVDVSTVLGAYAINTAIAGAGFAIGLVYLALRIRRHTNVVPVNTTQGLA